MSDGTEPKKSKLGLIIGVLGVFGLGALVVCAGIAGGAFYWYSSSDDVEVALDEAALLFFRVAS